MTVHIGVTGHREERLRQAGLLEAPLRERIRQALLTVQAKAGEATLRVVSPLAEGADRLVAEEALKLNFELQCPLPFRREEYEKDFQTPESRERFQALLARASAVQELDGSRAARAAAYEAVGRAVLRQCDVLIAVWDGQPPRSRGGTGQIVEEALALEIPVLWIGPGTGPAVLLTQVGPPATDASARLRLRPRAAAVALEGGDPEEHDTGGDGDVGDVENPGA